ncbi:MAG: hypothetical protein ACK5TA_05085, partial [bacterium]
PSGLGASPRPELVGPWLAGLHDTLVDSVRMGFLHTSRMRGRIPRGLGAAANVRFVGMEGSGDDLTKLHFKVARFGDVAGELFDQRQLWDDGPKPEQTAFDLLALSLGDVRNQRGDSSRYDHGLLNRFAKYRSSLNRGVDSILIEGSESKEACIDPVLVASAESLRKQTPPSRRVRLCGKLDMLGVSRKVMGLYLEDGTLVTALWNTEDFTGLAGYLDKDVVIEGLAVFRPSGRLLRIDADAIDSAGSRDSYFSVLPLPGVVDYAAAVRVRPGSSPYKDLLGMIPGEESDEEFLKAIEEAC